MRADVTARVTVANEGTNAATFDVEQSIRGCGRQDGRAQGRSGRPRSSPGDSGEFSCVINGSQSAALVARNARAAQARHHDPRRTAPWWTVTKRPSASARSGFDPDQGFFLNGKHVEIKGTNNHQDHAGVGVAMPDALQEFRIARLKEIGLQRLSLLAQSAHAGIARRLRPPGHAGASTKTA